MRLRGEASTGHRILDESQDLVLPGRVEGSFFVCSRSCGVDLPDDLIICQAPSFLKHPDTVEARRGGYFVYSFDALLAEVDRPEYGDPLLSTPQDLDDMNNLVCVARPYIGDAERHGLIAYLRPSSPSSLLYGLERDDSRHSWRPQALRQCS